MSEPKPPPDRPPPRPPARAGASLVPYVAPALGLHTAWIPDGVAGDVLWVGMSDTGAKVRPEPHYRASPSVVAYCQKQLAQIEDKLYAQAATASVALAPVDPDALRQPGDDDAHVAAVHAAFAVAVARWEPVMTWAAGAYTAEELAAGVADQAKRSGLPRVRAEDRVPEWPAAWGMVKGNGEATRAKESVA